MRILSQQTCTHLHMATHENLSHLSKLIRRCAMNLYGCSQTTIITAYTANGLHSIRRIWAHRLNSFSWIKSVAFICIQASKFFALSLSRLPISLHWTVLRFVCHTIWRCVHGKRCCFHHVYKHHDNRFVWNARHEHASVENDRQQNIHMKVFVFIFGENVIKMKRYVQRVEKLHLSLSRTLTRLKHTIMICLVSRSVFINLSLLEWFSAHRSGLQIEVNIQPYFHALHWCALLRFSCLPIQVAAKRRTRKNSDNLKQMKKVLFCQHFHLDKRAVCVHFDLWLPCLSHCWSHFFANLRFEAQQGSPFPFE